MKMKTVTCVAGIMLLSTVSDIEASGTYYNYTDTNSTRKTTTWVPDNLTTVRGILLNGNGAGGDYTPHAYHLHKQAFCEKYGFILVATGFFNRFDDGIGGADWNALMDSLGYTVTQTGHSEITNAPFVNYGFSNGGQMAYDLAYLIPDRTIAFCANKGGYYITETNGPVTVPGILIAGEVDTAFRRDSISNLYVNGRSQGAPWAWLEEENVGHDYGNSEALLFGFYSEVIAQRYPTNLYPTATTQPTLLPVVETNGWLVDQSLAGWESGCSAVQPSAGYSGDKLQLGWVPGEEIARLYRAAASFDRSVSTSFSPFLKPMVTRFPGDPLGYSTGKLYYPGQPVHCEVDIAPSITGWQKAEFFDGTNKLAEITDNSTNTLSIDLMLDGNRKNNSVYTVLTLADDSRRVSSISMLQSDTLRTPTIPSALTADAATNGVATTVNSQTFSWTKPTNTTSVLGYSYALNEEPDETAEGTMTSAGYTNLANGTYTFKVRAKSTSTVWGPSASFELIVQSIGTIVLSTNSLSVDEGGTATFDVTMIGPASTSVTLTVARVSGDTNLSISAGSSLVFAAGAWNTPQTVTIAAAQDSDADNGSALFSISGTGIPAVTVTTTETDDDIGIIASTGTLDVPENSTAAFSIALSRTPASSITVSVARVSGDTDLSISGTSTFTFTSNDWNSAQTVTIAAADDADQTQGSALFECSAPGAISAQVAATEIENDYSLVAAGLLAAWNLDYVTSSPIVTNANAYFMATGLVQSVLTHSDPSELRGGVNALKAIDNDDASIAAAISTGNYFYWQIEPQSGCLVSITSIVVRTDIDDGHPTQRFVLSDASGIDASSTLLEQAGEYQISTADLSARQEFQNHSDAIEFRVYGYNDNSQYTAIYIGKAYAVDNSDDIQVYGTVIQTGVPNPSPVFSSESLTIPEGGSTNLQIRLSSEPAQTVTAMISRVSGSTNLTITTGASLIYTPADWNQWQTVTVTALQDDDTQNDAAIFSCTGDGLLAAGFEATSVDDDEPAGGVMTDRWLFDFGSTSYLTAGNWNQLTSAYSTGVLLSGAVNTNGDVTPVEINVLSSFSGVNTGGVVDGSVYPSSAQRDSFYLTGTGTTGTKTQAIVRVQGLNTSLVYNVTFFGSRAASTDTNRTMRFTIGSNIGYLNADANTTNTVTLAGISAPAGYFDIVMDPCNAQNMSSYAYISVMDIEAMEQPASSSPGDSDGDSLPDLWEITYFGGATNANPAALAANGINTVLEAYVAGLDPTDPADRFTVSNVWNTLSWHAVSGRTYAVWWSTNLAKSFQPLETNITWPQAAFTDAVHQAEPNVFYKLEVQMN